VLDRGGADPVTVDAALSSVRGSEGVVLEHLLQRGEQAAGREDAIVMTAATLVRGAQDAGLQRLFGWIGESSRPEWQRAALLRGTEVALLNAPMPGQPGRRGGGPNPNAPCPTCPGARGGPRGAYAFPGGPTAPATQFVNPFTKQGPPPDMAHTPPEELLRQAEVTPPIAQGAARRLATVVDGRGAAAGGGGGGRGGRGGANLRVGREPVPLSALAAGGGELGTRAAAVLARVDWPGKPGAAVPVPPLTELEQQRFAAGQEVYKTICIACHQADGRGQDRIAPSLVGSTLTLATPGVGARIVLHGKEGPVGVMPPLGPALSDDQIAGVLTYIRREWGQAASPVDPAAVREVRGQTSGRSRPWTQEELDGVK
jgi:mono/diheme cytochrome c family protein